MAAVGRMFGPEKSDKGKYNYNELRTTEGRRTRHFNPRKDNNTRTSEYFDKAIGRMVRRICEQSIAYINADRGCSVFRGLEACQGKRL